MNPAQPWPDHPQDLYRKVLHGLMCEWKSAVACLPAGYQARMHPPLFTLAPYGRRWGHWHRERRELAIRVELALDYPWMSVRDVLLHEMAHQLTDEVLGGDTTPHGETFRAACELLSADPRASGDYAPLPQPSAAGEQGDNDRILLRVGKLLALAQSDNRHEAEAAMAKAHEHVARYNLDRLAMAEGRSYCSVSVGEPVVRCPEYNYALARLLCDFYFVEGLWIPAYVLKKGRMGRILEISGLPENVKMAGYVHAFLRRALHDQWALFNVDGRHSLHRKTDFGVGLVQGFRQKLQAQERELQAANGATWALIKTGDAHLKGYFRKRHPRIRNLSGRQRRVDIGVHRAGEKVGRATVLSRPIEGRHGNRRLLLGA